MSIESAKFQEEYGNLGIKRSEQVDLNPKGLQTMMPNISQQAGNPSALASGRYSQELTIGGSSSSRRIRLTSIESQDPVQSPNSLVVIDDQNNIIASIGDVDTGLFAPIVGRDLDGKSAALLFRPLAITSAPNPLLLVQDDSNDTLSYVIELATNTSFPLGGSGHFSAMIGLLGNATIQVWISDGTTPNGALTATKGSICLFASATGQIAYNTNGSTAWTLI